MATITKRGEAYRIRCSLGYDSQGKQVIRSTTWKPDPGMTPRQIEKALDREAVLFEERCKSGGGDPHITFEKFTEKWLQEYAESHLKAKTIHEYRGMSARTYAAIGHIHLDRLRPRHFREFFSQLSQTIGIHTGKPLSPRTVWNYYTFCSSVMGYAVRNELIDRNPCKAAAPKAPETEIVCLDDEQAAAFLAALEGEPLETRAMLTTVLLTGFRRAELLGLEWPDIDFDRCTITIRRTSQYTNTDGIYTETPKTRQSARTIKVSESLIELLRRYKLEQATVMLERGDLWMSDWISHQRLFTNQIGGPMHPNIPLRRLKAVLKKAGLPEVTLHSLRHTNATVMIAEHVNIRTVASRLGHTKPSTTLNIYADAIQSADAAAAQAVDEVFLKKRA